MLIDEIRGDFDTFKKHMPLLLPSTGITDDDLANATVIESQNVCDYYEELSKDHSWNFQDHFPNIAPPLPCMWFEWKLQNYVYNFGVNPYINPDHERINEHMGMFQLFTGKRVMVGALLRSAEIDSEVESFRIQEALVARTSQSTGQVGSNLNIRPDNVLARDDDFQSNGPHPLVQGARWISRAAVWLKQPNFLDPDDNVDDVFHLGELIYLVGQRGEILYGQSMWVNSPVHAGIRAYQNRLQARLLVALHPMFLALSFMHCRNVRLDQEPAPPSKLQKARQRKGKKPLMRRHTIVIDPMKKVLAAAAVGSGRNLSPNAVHICRGHFKDFSQHGLFGKYRGVYWWPMQVRGNKDAGVVIADYAVKPEPKNR